MEKACGGYYTRVEPEQDNAVQIAILRKKIKIGPEPDNPDTGQTVQP